MINVFSAEILQGRLRLFEKMNEVIIVISIFTCFWYGWGMHNKGVVRNKAYWCSV